MRFLYVRLHIFGFIKCVHNPWIYDIVFLLCLESVYSVPVGSQGGPNEQGDIYDEVSNCSVLEPCPYEVPVIVETDVDSGCYENISIKRSSKMLANGSLKMNNAGLYESLLVIQRETSVTGSDVGSICEVREEV